MGRTMREIDWILPRLQEVMLDVADNLGDEQAMIIKRAGQLLETALPETQWQTMEWAPTDGSCILAINARDTMPPEIIQWMPATDNEPGAWSDGRKCFRTIPFTHWMRLPAPPNAGIQRQQRS